MTLARDAVAPLAPWRRVVLAALSALFLILIGLAIWVAIHGRLDYTLDGARHSLRRVTPVSLAAWLMILAAGRIVGSYRRDAFLTRADEFLASKAVPLAVALAVAVAVAGVRFGGLTAAGADPYGYVSQSLLWARGNPVQQLPLYALDAPVGVGAFCPLGYRPGTVQGTMVPGYAPGLPLQMATAIKIGGERAGYWVVPAFAGLAIWLTFAIARRFLSPGAALVAAVVTAASPVFLFEMMQPMSDVPVTAWCLAAIALLLRGTSSSAIAAGMAASMAILTRPNIVPILIPAAAVALVDRGLTAMALRRMTIFAVACLPGIALVAISNAVFFGSPTSSGYGSLREIYHLQGAAGTVWRYIRWLWDMHSVLIFVPLLLPMAAGLSGRSIERRTVRFAWVVFVFFVVLLACYAPYIRFDHWSFLRFLLPAIPLLFIAALIALSALLKTRTAAHAAAVMSFVVLMFPFAYVHSAAKGDAFVMREGFKRAFEQPAAFARQELPANAIFIALTQTGSLRHYGVRPTIRYENVDASAFDGLCAYLRQEGFDPWVALDRLEVEDFRARFGTTATGRGALSDTPIRVPPDGQVLFIHLVPARR